MPRQRTDLAPRAAPGPISRNPTLATCPCTRATALERSDKDPEGIIAFYSCEEIGLCRTITVCQTVEPLKISDVGIWLRGDSAAGLRWNRDRDFRPVKKALPETERGRRLCPGVELGLAFSRPALGVQALCQERHRARTGRTAARCSGAREAQQETARLPRRGSSGPRLPAPHGVPCECLTTGPVPRPGD